MPLLRIGPLDRGIIREVLRLPMILTIVYARLYVEVCIPRHGLRDCDRLFIYRSGCTIFFSVDHHTSPEASPPGLLRIGRFGCTAEDF